MSFNNNDNNGKDGNLKKQIDRRLLQTARVGISTKIPSYYQKSKQGKHIDMDAWRKYKSPERRAHFEDDVIENDNTFAQSFRKNISKYEYFYGPYKINNQVEQPVYEDCVRKELDSRTIQNLLKTSPQIVNDISGRGPSKKRKGKRKYDFIFSKQGGENTDISTETFTDVFSRLQSRQEKRYIDFSEQQKLNSIEQRQSTQSPWKPIADKITDPLGRQFYMAMSRVKDRELIKNFLQRLRSKPKSNSNTFRESLNAVGLTNPASMQLPDNNPIADLKIQNSQYKQPAGMSPSISRSQILNSKNLYKAILKRNYGVNNAKQTKNNSQATVAIKNAHRQEENQLNKDMAMNVLNQQNNQQKQNQLYDTQNIINEELLEQTDDDQLQTIQHSRNHSGRRVLTQNLLNSQLKNLAATTMSLKQRQLNILFSEQNQSYDSSQKVDYAKSYKITSKRLQSSEQFKRRTNRCPQAVTAEVTAGDLQTTATPLYLQNTISLHDLVMQQGSNKCIEEQYTMSSSVYPKVENYPSYRQQRYNYYKEKRKMTKSMSFV